MHVADRDAHSQADEDAGVFSMLLKAWHDYTAGNKKQVRAAGRLLLQTTRPQMLTYQLEVLRRIVRPLDLPLTDVQVEFLHKVARRH